MLRVILAIGFVLLFWSGNSVCVYAGSGETVRDASVKKVELRMKKLDYQTPLPLDYNQHVQAYIDVYTRERTEHLSNILGRADLYFPLFEEYLDKYDLPLELKYLAVTESALEPRARSSSGAYGLWQFLFQSSRMFELEVNSYVDERADPVKATDAACRYLKYLYANFDDWLLAIAAYNGGIGAVKEAIIKSGGERDYWKLRPYLSEQVRGYVPAFVAVNYAMSHYESYGIQPKPAVISYDDIVTTSIKGGISFRQISEQTGISMDLLRLLNPSYKMDFIPVQSSSVRIVVPEDKIELLHEKQPFFFEESAPPSTGISETGDTTGREKTNHIVAPGEFFHQIAMKYNCRIEDLMKWNGFEDKFLFAGQILTVWKPEENNMLRIEIPEIEERLRFFDLNADARSKNRPNGRN